MSYRHGDSVNNLETDTRLDDGTWAEATETRLPGLTILFHPDFHRIGERAFLPGLESGEPQQLSRLEPQMAPPGSSERRPLADPRLSRTPIRLQRSEAGDTIRLTCLGTRTAVEVDGQPVATACVIPFADLEHGVVLLLGGRIVLLLHLLDPLRAADLPRFGILGESPQIVRLRREIQQVADLAVPVLLRGETGTGKELVAQAIHNAGPRRTAPFVAVNLAAVPTSLAAAELFGSAKGAFTGADRRRSGYFSRAQRGTLFLDEIGEAQPDIQVLLLRALESGEIQPVGAEKPEKVNVRVISATDTDLESAIDAERFRAPLLYRLSGFVMRIPPLRERREDLGRLLAHFVRRELEAIGEVQRLENHREPWLPAPLVARLARHPWPGNVRQLANVARQLVIANRGAERIVLDGEIEDLLGLSALPKGQTAAGTSTPTVSEPGPSSATPMQRKPADIDEHELIAALQASRWRIQAAATQLGLCRTSIYDLIAKSDKIRKASDLEREEIEASHKLHGGRVASMADALEVSERALRRRIGQLGLAT